MNCQMETDSMNDFRLPENDKHAEPRCAPHSRSRHGRRSAKGIDFKWILPVAMLSAGVRLAAAEATADTNDVPSAAAEEKDESGLPDPFSAKWKFLLGGGVINGPRYPGSRYDFTRGLPLVSISYGRFFIGAVPGPGAPARIG